MLLTIFADVELRYKVMWEGYICLHPMLSFHQSQTFGKAGFSKYF